MKQNIKIIFSVLAVFLIFACSKKDEDAHHHDHPHSDGDTKSELVREGIIDVQSIDTDKDGNIYECPMDWNVLNDKDGDCPVCGMKLKEYSIAEIKDNLTKYGYEYKK